MATNAFMTPQPLDATAPGLWLNMCSWKVPAGFPSPAADHTQNANPHLNPQAKVPYPPTTAATPNAKVANVAKQVSDVDDKDAANTSTPAQPTPSQRVPTLPNKNALLTQKKGITAFKRA